LFGRGGALRRHVHAYIIARSTHHDETL